MSLKSLIIINDSASITGGAGKVAIDSAIKLSKIGYNVLFFSAMGPIDQRLTDSGVNVVCLQQKDILSDSNRLRAITQGIWNFRARQSLKQCLTEFSPDDTVVHLHSWIKSISPSILSVLKKSNFELFLSLHDYFTFCPNGGLYNYQTRKICNIKPSSLKCYLCNCDSRNYFQKMWRDIRQVVQNFFLPKMHIIALGDLNKNVSFSSLSKVAKTWHILQNPIDVNTKSQIDITSNNKYIFIARLSYEKGVELFCQALSDLGLKGIVLGDGPLFDVMKNSYPNIEFPGWISGEEKEDYIRQAKALVFPSLWYEGSPLTTLEIKSYGLPCIVSDKCAATEQITDGVDGFVFEMGNLESLKSAINKFENSDLSLIKRNVAANFNVSNYSMDNHIKKLLDIYNSILH